jgi:hypothetical protein
MKKGIELKLPRAFWVATMAKEKAVRQIDVELVEIIRVALRIVAKRTYLQHFINIINKSKYFETA